MKVIDHPQGVAFWMMVGICYGLIARHKIVLCDQRLTEGNFESVSQSVLHNVMSKNLGAKVSFDSGKHVYHTYVNHNLVYVCVTESLFDKNVAFKCLFELEQKLHSMGLAEVAQAAGPYALRRSFSETMASVLAEYSSNDILGRMESQVEEVAGVMRQNIDKVVQRGENLDNLTERSDLLAHASTDFRQNATKLRKKLCFKNAKMWLFLIFLIFFLILICVVIIISILAAKGKL